MTLAAFPRRQADLLAPFADSGAFQGLKVEHCETLAAADLAFEAYERDGDEAALAAQRAGFFRAIFTPALAQSLAPSRSEAEREAFASGLEDGVRRRMSGKPVRIDHLVGMIALAKRDAD
jgi:hypothetical protein